MAGSPEYSGTIPRLLAAAAARDPGGVWLRTDEIVVLDHGRIAEAGDHASLLAGQGRYAELAA